MGLKTETTVSCNRRQLQTLLAVVLLGSIAVAFVAVLPTSSTSISYVWIKAKDALLASDSKLNCTDAGDSSRCPDAQTAPATGQHSWTPQCYDLNDSGAAWLDPEVVAALTDRQAKLQPVDDWFQLTGSTRSALQRSAFRIPRVLHQVWLGPKAQPAAWLDTWRVDYISACPGWQHKLWTSANLAELQHLDQDFFDSETTWFGRADILRAAVLFEQGGVYIDADTQWVNGKCLDDIMLLASDTGFLAAIEPKKQHAANGVIAAVRHHPVMKLHQQAQVILSTGGRGGDPWQRLGPLAISAAMTVADNHASSAYCSSARRAQPAPAGGRLVLQQQYFDEDVPADMSFLMTALHSQYFYPASWLDHNMKDVSNLTYVSELVKSKYPHAYMYQLGFSTHAFSPASIKH